VAHPYDDLAEIFPDFGRLAAFTRQVGGREVVEGVLSGELTVERVGTTLQIKEAVRPLFDKNGRRIPPRGLVANVCDPNREFALVQPEIDYSAWLERFDGTGLSTFISGADFEARAKELLQALGQNEQTKNLLKGVHLPVVIPHTQVADLGQTIEEFVAAAGKSYSRQFPDRSFKNYRQGELAGQVTIVDGSRYERLIDDIAESSVVSIYFPNPLQGFSVDAQREQMATLPESFILSGPLDTAMGWIMHTNVLARDYQTPVYDCSAVQWQSSEDSLCFKACDDGAYFGLRADLADAYDGYSGGLLFIG